MKKIGVKYPVYANYSDTTGTPVYSGGGVIAKAMKIGLKWDKNDTQLYADDGLDDIDQSITGGSETLAVNELTHTIQAALLGHTINGNGELVVNQSDIAPYVGHGFYGKVKRNGVFKWRAVWLHKEQFAEPDDESETQGEKIAFQTPTIEGKIMKDINGNFKTEKVFDAEPDAIAWLNGKAGIPVSASSGLTGLALTGAGGALSPAFAVATRYYTFGGMTGASFTVTATATNHTIQLYINDTLTQTLSSGVASLAVAIAASETKKVRIVVFEVGKQSQTTEVIVVRP